MNQQIRWLTKNDIKQIQELNSKAPVFYNVLGEIPGQAITWVIEQQDYIIGYLSYTSRISSFRLEYISIREDLRGCGYGSQLLCRLIGCAINTDKTILVKVEGRDIASLMFFKANGFKAVAIVEEDVFEYYLMEWRKEGNVLFSSLC